jgi:hypothetical protein
MAVMMVEVGGVIGTAAGAHVRNGTVSDEQLSDSMNEALVPHANDSAEVTGIPGSRGIHAVGGMLTHWAHMVPRPELTLEWDGTIPVPQMDALLDEASALMWATEDLYGDGSDSQRALLRRLISFTDHAKDARPPGRMALAARRLSTGKIEYAGADTLLMTDGTSGHISIVPGFVVRRIMHDGARATAIEAHKVDGGPAIRIEADVIVVGAGVIGTPQLLEASGIQPNALGRYLTDHLNVVTRVQLQDDLVPPPAEYEGVEDLTVALRIPVSRNRPFQVGVLRIPSAWHAGVLRDVDPRLTIDLGAFIGNEPLSTNRLTFDAQRPDRFGMPRVTAQFTLSGDDHTRVAQAIAEQYELAAAIGKPWDGMSPMLRPIGSSLHLMGTYRIGRDAETSVADPGCRVWGWDNLYLAGNGLLGSRNSCNPTLTTVALGLRAGQAIAGDESAILPGSSSAMPTAGDRSSDDPVPMS